MAGAEWFCFAGLWRPATDDTGESFTLLTTEPGPDVVGTLYLGTDGPHLGTDGPRSTHANGKAIGAL
jgi:hypothetical protein